MAGIPEGAMDSGGKSWTGEGDKGERKPIAMYARLLEFGGDAGKGGKHPPRPVFQPTLKEFRVDEAETIGRKHLFVNIAGAWR